MKARRIRDGIFWMGAVDWDNRLFDSLVPLPDGTSYNAYLVQGRDRTALIDTVEPSMAGRLLEQLDGVEDLDYVVSLHAEQDHSGTIPDVLARYPGAKLVVSPKAEPMLTDHLGVAADRFLVVADGDTLDLGGRTLRFVSTPWMHWPETMSAFLEEDRILFSCDFFGAHVATSDLFVRDRAQAQEAAKRYYAEILMPFAKSVRKNLDKVEPLRAELIAPSHGPIHDDPGWILGAYRDWASETPRNRAAIAYVTMHESTKLMVDRLVAGLVDRGVGVDQFNLVVTDLGKLAMALVDAATLVFASPVVLNGPHPHAVYAAYVTNMLKPKARFVALTGSFGWKGMKGNPLGDLLGNLKAEFLDPVWCRGHPTLETLAELDALAGTIAGRHEALGLD